MAIKIGVNYYYYSKVRLFVMSLKVANPINFAESSISNETKVYVYVLYMSFSLFNISKFVL